jgi:hypothetical protein
MQQLPRRSLATWSIATTSTLSSKKPAFFRRPTYPGRQFIVAAQIHRFV